MQRVIVVLWRKIDKKVEFFFPPGGLKFLSTMSFITTEDDPAEAARRWIAEKFSLSTRSNARIFQGNEGRVVAFNPSSGEVATLKGRWTTLLGDMPNGQADAYFLLHDLEERLLYGS